MEFDIREAARAVKDYPLNLDRKIETSPVLRRSEAATF